MSDVPMADVTVADAAADPALGPLAVPSAPVARERPAVIRKAVVGMSGETLASRRVPGKWSTLEVLCHLADFDPVRGKAALICRLTEEMRTAVSELHTGVCSGTVAFGALQSADLHLVRAAHRQMSAHIEAGRQQIREIEQLIDSLLTTARATE